ncbi:MAG: FAD-dependent oxidoreductase [Thermodesulfobacteriota bacterium]
MKDRKKIVILGAGPSGLSVAWELSKKKGFDVTLLERGWTVGGLAQTITHDGLRFDIGPHRLSPQLPEIVDAVKALLGDDLLTRENIHGVYLHDSFYHYPPGLKDFLRPASIKATFLFGLSWAAARIKDVLTSSDSSDHSFDLLLKRYFGKKFYNEVIVPMLFKVWGTEDLHHEFAKIRFELPTFSRMLKRIFIKSSKVNDDLFYYPKNGFGQIWDSVADHVTKNGHKVTNSVQIKEIQASNLSGPFLVKYVKDGKQGEIEADTLVSTISNKDLLAYLKGSGLVEPLIEKMPAFGSRTLRLGIVAVKSFNLPARVIIFPEEKYIFNRISEMNHFADLGYPEGQSILMIDVICDSGGKIDKTNEDEFNRLLLDSFLSLNWCTEADVKKVFSLRFPGAYPVLTEERYEAQVAAEEFFKGSELLLCGREASSDYNNAHNAVGKGFITARFIAGEIEYDEYKTSSTTMGRLPIQD